MTHAGSRLRQIGWMVVLVLCAGGFVALTFRVNAIKSEVRLAEREIIALERQKVLLETEFQTRANQQQLADWNRIDFGFDAPTAAQYITDERDLAALSTGRGPGAPEPVRVARAEQAEAGGMFALVSPMTGAAFGEADMPLPAAEPLADSDASLAERLSVATPLDSAASETGE